MRRLGLFVLFIIAACGVDSPVNKLLGIQPASASVLPFQQVQLAMVAQGVGTITWTIQEGAVGGTISSTGLYTAPGCSALGTYHIVASSGGISSPPAALTVVDGVKSVAVTPSTASVVSGGTQQFTATVTSICGVTSQALLRAGSTVR
jgi:hypothetical protein